jgi:hypothetical protein
VHGPPTCRIEHVGEIHRGIPPTFTGDAEVRNIKVEKEKKINTSYLSSEHIKVHQYSSSESSCSSSFVVREQHCNEEHMQSALRKRYIVANIFLGIFFPTDDCRLLDQRKFTGGKDKIRTPPLNLQVFPVLSASTPSPLQYYVQCCPIAGTASLALAFTYPKSCS